MEILVRFPELIFGKGKIIRPKNKIFEQLGAKDVNGEQNRICNFTKF